MNLGSLENNKEIVKISKINVDVRYDISILKAANILNAIYRCKGTLQGLLSMSTPQIDFKKRRYNKERKIIADKLPVKPKEKIKLAGNVIPMPQLDDICCSLL